MATVTANGDTYVTNEDETLTILLPGVLANDTNTGGNPLFISGITFPTHGSISVSSDGSFIYTPVADFNGVDTFTYTASDGVSSSTSTVAITVNPVNDPPEPTNVVLESQAGLAYAFKSADFPVVDPHDNPANALKSMIIVSLPERGVLMFGGQTVTANQAISAADVAAGKLVYTPPLDALGQHYASFQFKIQDDGGTDRGGQDTSVAATVTIDASEVALVSTDGTTLGNNESIQPAISGDGRYIAFVSDATNLGPGGVGNTFQVYLKDMQTGAVALASTGGNGAGDNASRTPSISGDGHLVAFVSDADNLVAGDTNHVPDVFVKDLQSGTVVLASAGANGEANAESSIPAISADGRYVAFTSAADNLVAGDTNHTSDIFLKDLQTGDITLLSTGPNGEGDKGSGLGSESKDGNHFIGGLSISSDGHYVAFASSADNLVANDTNGVGDVFVADTVTGTVTLVSTGANGPGNFDSDTPSISGDGRYVLFESRADNLVANDTNNAWDLFVKDLQTGSITRVTDGTHALVIGSGSISADGHFVTFASSGDDRVAGDANGSFGDIFIYDVQTGAVRLVSSGPNGGANSDNNDPTISGDGRYVAFDSVATNLIADDTNGVRNVFIRDIGPPLFTGDDDLVNFNSLTPDQLAAITGVSNIVSAFTTDAGNGDDSVTLPDIANYQLTAGFAWNPQTTFQGGAGDDTITGGDGTDRINAGDGNDTIIGSRGNDQLAGGAGDDTFDYQTNGFNSFTDDTLQTLDGGDGKDVVKLPGAPSDYTFKVGFNGGDDPALTDTTIATTPASGLAPATVTFDTKNIEKVEFAAPVNNTVALTEGSVAVEMLELASEAYGPLPTLEHSAESLAWEQQADLASTEFVTLPAQARGWHALSALELGMNPADFGQQNSILYSMVGGHYQAIDANDSLQVGLQASDNSEANAIVLTGLVNGKRTLAISFRGTDQVADFADYTNFASYYAKYKPLIDALTDYVNDPDNGIEQVLVSGHSLGAGIVQYFMQDFPDTSSYTVRAYTDGSPGAEAAQGDVRIENFVHTDDAVTDVPFITTPAIKLALIGAITNAVNLEAGPTAALAVGAFLNNFAEKTREGQDVRIDSDIANFPGIDEHDSHSYTSDVTKLVLFAEDSGSPFSASELAQSLRTDSTYVGPPVQIAEGKLGSSVVQVYGSDDYVLGENGGYSITMWDDPASDSVVHVVDGGAGNGNEVALRGTVLDYTWQSNATNYGPEWDLYANLSSLTQIGQLYRVDKLVFTGGSIGSVALNGNGLAPRASLASNAPTAPAGDPPDPYVVHLDGTPTTVQTIQPGQTALIVDHSFDYADTGDGDVAVTGTNLGDTIVIGSGNDTITDGSGNDLIFVKDAATAGNLVIDSGAGDDLIRAGGGNDTLTGGSGHNIIDAGAGNDQITTTADGADVIDGGDGNDTWIGQLQSQTGPLVFMQVGPHAFTVSDPTTIENVENLVINSGSGNDVFSVQSDSGNITVDGGAGKDFLSIDWSQKSIPVSLIVNPDGHSGQASGGTDVINFSNIESVNINGGSADDNIHGLSGDDHLHGGAGSDVLTGGAGADTFGYGAGDGADTITDFNPGEGDKIDLRGFPGIHSLADLPVKSVGNDTVLDFGNGDTLTLKNFNSNDLTTVNFVFSINHAPTTSDQTITTTENQAYTFQASDFPFADSDGNALAKIIVMSAPGAGTLALDGVPINTSGGKVEVTKADIDSAKLVFTPATSTSGAHYATFQFAVEDNGGTNNGGVDTSTTATMTINVSSVPTAENHTANVLEDQPYAFQLSDFPVATLPELVIFNTIPSTGTLAFGGAKITAGEWMSASNIANGLVTFTPGPDANGANYASFQYEVADTVGSPLSIGGLQISALSAPATLTIDVTPVNDAPQAVPPALRLASIGPFGMGDSDSNIPGLSADGRFVVFSGIADNLVANDTNGSAAPVYGEDVFVIDLQTGNVARASTSATGAQSNGISEGFSISGDGRYVVFDSQASNLVPNDPDGTATDVFVKDLQTGAIALVGHGGEGSISADGHHVVFIQGNDVVVTDLTTGQSAIASTGPNGAPNGQSNFFPPSINADGRYVVFGSLADNLVANDTNGSYDLFIKDMQTGVISLVSSGISGPANGGSFHASISADGRYVAFDSMATNLLSSTDANGNLFDVYVKDMETGLITLVSSGVNGQGNLSSYSPTISADGRYVAFASDATNLVTNDTAHLGPHLYVKDLLTGELKFIGVQAAIGAPTPFGGPKLAISADGRFVSFEGNPDQGPPYSQVFVYDTRPPNGNTVTTQADQPYTFQLSDFPFSDPHDNPANGLQNIIATSLTSTGSLTLNGIPVSINQTISVADITAGHLIFTPPPHTGAITSFQFEVQDNGGTANGGQDTSAPATMTIDVIGQAPVLAGQITLAPATEGVALTNAQVATFTDTNLGDTAGTFTATINWGDGSSSAGTITGTNGSFAVAGSHTYADEASAAALSVSITDTANNTSLPLNGTVVVGEGDALTPHAVTFTANPGQAFNGTVATFTDSYAGNTAGDLIASIDWGDGTITAGVVSGSNGSFAVSGTHTYAGSGQDAVTVTLTDDAPGTATATANSTANVGATDHPPVIVSNGGGNSASIIVKDDDEKFVTKVHAIDPDPNTKITYSLVGGANEKLFKIDPNTGILSFKSEPKEGHSYQVTVAASDGVLKDTQTINVKVFDGSVRFENTCKSDSFEFKHFFDVEGVNNLDAHASAHDILELDDPLSGNGDHNALNWTVFDAMKDHGVQFGKEATNPIDIHDAIVRDTSVHQLNSHDFILT